MKGIKVGVLQLQGDFYEHQKVLEKLGAEVIGVKLPEDLEGLNGLIIPGGESTTISYMLKMTELDKAILNRVNEGMGVFGTCAGTIVLAKEVTPSKPEVNVLGLIDMKVNRNAYGRQKDSFEAEVKVKGKPYHAIFIRAPRIEKVGEGVEVLGSLDGEPVLVKQGKVMACTFHPELNYSFPEGRELTSAEGDLLPPEEIHRMFLELISG